MNELKELVLATHNEGKAREIAALLEPYIPQFYNAKELNLPEPEETEDSFVGNALLKAHNAAKLSGKPSLADDSGLAVNALGGQPGIHSARWAYPPQSNTRDFSYAMKRVHDALTDASDRSAAFICVLALAWPDGQEAVFEGRVEGEIVWPPRGENGFGYDPIFQPHGYDITFGEMEPAAKHAISHRADAFKKLVDSVFKTVA